MTTGLRGSTSSESSESSTSSSCSWSASASAYTPSTGSSAQSSSRFHSRSGPGGVPTPDQRRRHRPLHLIDGEGHQQVVAPCPVDLEVAAQQTLLAEPDLCQHGPAGGILRADGGLDAMQHHRTEAVVET